MSARCRPTSSAKIAGDTKCCVGSCGDPMSVTCTWKEHELNAETGERIYNGKVCNLRLCDAHATKVPGGGALCAWHTKIATERGLLAPAEAAA